MPIQHINPEGLSSGGGYTHVVIGQGNRTVYLAGQVAYDGEGRLVGEGDLGKQAEQVFENIKTCLAAAGATFADVVKMTTYVVNYNADLRPAIVAVRQKYLPADHPPASTLVGVQALARPELLIEVEAVAVLP